MTARDDKKIKTKEEGNRDNPKQPDAGSLALLLFFLSYFPPLFPNNRHTALHTPVDENGLSPNPVVPLLLAHARLRICICGRPPTRSRGMSRSSEPCLMNTFPAVWAGLMPTPSLVMIAEVAAGTLNSSATYLSTAIFAFLQLGEEDGGWIARGQSVDRATAAPIEADHKEHSVGGVELYGFQSTIQPINQPTNRDSSARAHTHP